MKNNSSRSLIKIFCISTFCAVLILIFVDELIAKKSKRTRSRGRKETVGDIIKKIESRQSRLKLKKQFQNFPKMQARKKIKKVDLKQIQPPKTRKRRVTRGGQPVDEIERLTDQSIKQMYKLVKRSRKSSRRGELWLRLAELYSEKAQYVGFRIENRYDEKLGKLKRGQKRPKLDLSPARKYVSKAIQLYEWFIRDYKTDPKMDQALFFLGYNYFDLGQVKKGEAFYQRLAKEYPKSHYVNESNFALGEFYFENEKWTKALPKYKLVARKKSSPLYGFASYKIGWCQYKLGDIKAAIKSMERVVISARAKRSGLASRSSRSSLIQMAKEATNDLVVFYVEGAGHRVARAYFRRVVGKKNLTRTLEKLAYHYMDAGRRDEAAYLFKDLIREKPNSSKAYNYQYQVVNMYLSAGQSKVYWKELNRWIERYGPKSRWFRSNKKDKSLVKRARQLIEASVRNYTLRLHKTAQNTRAAHTQKLAKMGYELYFDTFDRTPQMDEMHFFYGELLFDIKSYEKAAYHYLWISDNAPKSKYLKQAVLNGLLAMEKNLPTSIEMQKIVGDATSPLEFDRSIVSFEKAAKLFFKKFPKSSNNVAIKYRLATLHYYYNHLDEASDYFFKIIKEHPRASYVKQAAEAILDIHNLRKDYIGLTKSANNMLAMPSIANSPLGERVRKIKRRTEFKLASNLEQDKKYGKSATAYIAFAQANKNSDLTILALFNAAVNFEKSQQTLRAIEIYKQVIAFPGKSKDRKDLIKRSRRFLGALYESTGQYIEAAAEFEKFASLYKKDRSAQNLYFNAAIIRNGLRHYKGAIADFKKYLTLSKGRSRFEVHFNMATIYEKRGQLTLATKEYQNYINKSGASPEKTVEAVFRIAKILERRQGLSKAIGAYQRTIKVQRNLSRGKKPVGQGYAARAKFKLTYKKFLSLSKLRFPKSAKKQGQILQQMTRLKGQIERELKVIVGFNYGPIIVAALTLQGQTVNFIAKSILKAPLPKQINTVELKQQYMEGLMLQVEPLQKEAMGLFQAAIKRVASVRGYGPWVEVAHKELGKLDVAKSPYYPFRVYQINHLDWLGI